MAKDNTDELIEELQKTRRELASHLYEDFFGNPQNVTGNAAPGSPAPVSAADPAQGGAAGENSAGQSGPAEGEVQADSEGPVTATAFGTEAPAAPAPKEEPEEDPMETLNNLIGLDKIKHDVRELTDFAKVQKARSDAGLKSVPVSLHLVFTGNPGTGKTTVARILAKLYKNIGILSKGQLVEVDRSGLVAGYVGQTAIKTQEQISAALGGVLFIDEAYALSQKQDEFGRESIDTILKAMEDHRDDLIVIVAGYTEPMEEFINSNPGLRSRFNKYIEFPDYSLDELMGIFDLNCKKYDYIVEEETRNHVREKLAAEKLANRENFANARAVRNLFEDIITNQSRRIAQMESPSLEDFRTINNDDLFDPEAAGPEAAEDEAGAQGAEEAAGGEGVQNTEQPDPDDWRYKW